MPRLNKKPQDPEPLQTQAPPLSEQELEQGGTMEDEQAALLETIADLEQEVQALAERLEEAHGWQDRLRVSLGQWAQEFWPRYRVGETVRLGEAEGEVAEVYVGPVYRIGEQWHPEPQISGRLTEAIQEATEDAADGDSDSATTSLSEQAPAPQVYVSASGVSGVSWSAGYQVGGAEAQQLSESLKTLRAWIHGLLVEGVLELRVLAGKLQESDAEAERARLEERTVESLGDALLDLIRELRLRPARQEPLTLPKLENPGLAAESTAAGSSDPEQVRRVLKQLMSGIKPNKS